MRAALIIIDGMADRSQQALGGRTPLEAARLPNLDRLAAVGSCGHMYPLGPGICPSSDLAHWRILGYGTYLFPGRAAIEAIGAGYELEKGDVVIRVNLAITTVEQGARYIQAAPAYLPEEQASRIYSSLSAYASEHFETKLHHLGGPFMTLVLSGGASPRVTDSDPLFFRLPVNPVVPLSGADGGAAEKTARELSRFESWAAGVLESHPVNRRREEECMPAINYVLMKWPSVPPDIPSFKQDWGFDACAVFSGVFYAGLARVLGMAPVAIEAENPEVEMRRKLTAALEALECGKDFVFVHTKAADEASHTGRPGRKVSALEQIDGALEIVVEHFAPDPDILTVITADHASPSGGSYEVIHSGESVPVLMAGRNVRVDAVKAFDEVACASGSLGLIESDDIMPLVLNLTDRAAFGTSRLSAEDLPYRPQG